MNGPLYTTLADSVRSMLPSYEAAVGEVPYEDKGILYSEILFMIACVKHFGAVRILESGRARGQSTLLLAKYLPQMELVSVEFNAESPDVAVAEERLRPHKNVTLLYGDARVMLPTLVQQDDAVVIDGPKMFRAIRLALRLLATGKPSTVFVHDVHIGTPERSFLEKFMPEALYSDAREVASISAHMDWAAVKYLAPAQRIDAAPTGFGYGFTLACLPRTNRPYKLLLVVAVVYDFTARVLRKLQSFAR